MEHVLGLRCLLCGEEYEPRQVDYVCPKHGDDGILDVVYDYRSIERQIGRTGINELGSGGGIWRYRPLLPVSPTSPVPPLLVGDTPLYQAPRMAQRLGLGELWVKDDGRQPSASFKDRASALAVVKARESQADIIATETLNGLFVLGRSIGMMGHVFDQKRQRSRLYRQPWDEILFSDL